MAEAVPRAWYTVAHDEGQYYLLVDLDEAAVSGDPLVYHVDHEGAQPAASDERLSGWLRGLTVPRPPSAKSRLARASAAGDVGLVRELVAAGGPLGAVGASGLPPLHLATFSSMSPEIVRTLLDAGADPNAVVTREIRSLVTYVENERSKGRVILVGSTPLFAAMTAFQNWWCRPYDVLCTMVRDLLAAGADPNLPAEDGTTPLHAAAGADYPEAVDIVRQLLTAGADVHAHARWEGTALHAALGAAPRETVEALLDAGADPCLPADPGWGVRGVERVTPMHYAFASNFVSEDIAALMLDRAGDVDLRTPEGVTPLHLSLKAHTTAKLQLLLDAGADPRVRLDNPTALGPDLTAHTPLDMAVELGNTAAAELLAAAL